MSRRIVNNRDSIHECIGYVMADVSQSLDDGPVQISVSNPKRSAIQSAKIHAMIGDIAKMVKFSYYNTSVDLRMHGSDRALEYCKALLVKWFDEEMRAIGEELKNPSKMMYCPRQNESFYCRPSTTEMSIKEMTKFVEWLYAVGAEIGVKWSERVKGYDEYPELNRG